MRIQTIKKIIQTKYYTFLDYLGKTIARKRGAQYKTREKLLQENLRSLKKTSKNITNANDKHNLQIKYNELEDRHKVLQKSLDELKDLCVDKVPDKIKLKAWSVRVRSANKCDICGSNEKLTAHHLWDKKNHPSLMYQDENGVCLCMICHNQFHAKYTAKSHVTPAMYQKFKILKTNGLTYTEK